MNFEDWYEQEIGSENKPEYEAAKWAWDYQQNKLDCCRDENKALLERVNELHKRIDEALNAADESCGVSIAAFVKLNRILKGNQDD